MVENDLKPCYVFDGKPPQLKSNVVRATVFRLEWVFDQPADVLSSNLQLKKRFSNRQEAKEDETEAKETGALSCPVRSRVASSLTHFVAQALPRTSTSSVVARSK